MQGYFSIIVFVCTGAWAIVVAEKFSTFKNFLSLTNLFRILLCIEDWQLSQQIHVVAQETWKISQTKVIKILLRTIKATAKLCKYHERNSRELSKFFEFRCLIYESLIFLMKSKLNPRIDCPRMTQGFVDKTGMDTGERGMPYYGSRGAALGSWLFYQCAFMGVGKLSLGPTYAHMRTTNIS